jgi:hypothetical protein
MQLPSGVTLDDLTDLFRETPALRSVQRRLERPELRNLDALPLWIAINLHSEAISYPNFDAFMQRVLCSDPAKTPNPGESELTDQLKRLRDRCFKPGLDAYKLLRSATETFLLLECGVCPPDNRLVVRPPVDQKGTGRRGKNSEAIDSSKTRVLDSDATYQEMQDKLTAFLGEDRNNYIATIIRNAFPEGLSEPNRSPFCALSVDSSGPCLLELIWSYWMEEGMLTQTINAMALRFQNVSRTGPGRDPLANLQLDFLRPLSGFLWGYIQDEPNRLTLSRRAYEYNHHYGLTLYGRAVPELTPADPRSNFLRAFHDLLRQCVLFYREDNDTTVIADAFAVLNALKNVHLQLSEGAGNQFRDLPWTARVEMLMQQWLLGRRESQEFLRGRTGVAYPEQWMGRVDAMKRLQGWTDVSAIHFRDLAVFGERLLLSIRYGNWIQVADQEVARSWARYWREEVQGYIHAYNMVTEVDLAQDVVGTNGAERRYLQPSAHIRNRVQSALERQPV